MKNKTKKANKKGKNSNLVASIILMFFGVMMLSYVPLNPIPKYNELKEKITTIDYFYINHNSKTSDDPILLTTDGNKFHIRSKYREKELREKLLPGLKVKIKYYEGKVLFIKKMNFAKEITIGNNVICKYRNTNIGDMIGMIISSCFFILPSIAYFLYWKNQKIKKSKSLNSKV